MSRRGGGSVNPFARTVQATGGQPNQNQRQQQQPQYNAPRGPPSGGGNQGGRNPFAQQAHTGSIFQQQQQAPSQQQQPRGPPFQRGQQQGNRPNQTGNPFAQSSGGMSRESSSMELDGFMADTRGNQFGGQQPQFQQRGGQQANNVFGQPRPQQQQQRPPQHGAGNPFAPSGGSNMAAGGPAAGRNPFAPSGQHSQAGGFMQQQTGIGMHNQQQTQGQANPFAQPSTGHIYQPQQAPQQQQQPQSSFFNQGFQQQHAAQPTSFFAAGGGAGPRNAGAGFAPPPKAVVNAATLSAVNVSAALAPSKVDDIDLGLGLAPPPVPAPIVTAATPPAPPTHSSSSTASQATQGADESSLQQEIAALLTQLLKDSPAASVSEQAPTLDPYSLMTVNGKLELVAGRVPAVAPQRQAHKPHHNALSGGGAGMVGHSGNVVGLGGTQGASRNPFFSAR
jgi:hypothetical protein